MGFRVCFCCLLVIFGFCMMQLSLRCRSSNLSAVMFGACGVMASCVKHFVQCCSPAKLIVLHLHWITVFLFRLRSTCLTSDSLHSRYIICGDVNVIASPWNWMCGGIPSSSSVESERFGLQNRIVRHAFSSVSLLASCVVIGA